MRTTIDIPEDLIKEAMRVTKAPTKTALIKSALTNIIQKNKIKSLKNYKGKIDITGIMINRSASGQSSY